MKCDWRGLIAALFACGLGSATLAEDAVRLQLPQTPAGSVTFAQGVANGDLQVFVGESAACCTGKSPIAGRYKTGPQGVSFAPYFDFVKGQTYTVRVVENGTPTLTEFSLGADADQAAPKVVAIYPSGDLLPANTLRFYVEFSAPMRPHVAFDYIKLVDASGQVDDAAFMQFKQELWSKDRKRLTVLMDPGRIKQGVAQNLALGPALLAGEGYRLEVSQGWPAATGATELAAFSKSFGVSQALRILPDVGLWQVIAPAPNTRQAVTIKLDRPFDRQLLQTMIKVRTQTGAEIGGDIRVENNETLWRFTPHAPWSRDAYEVVVDSKLEDVAGNNFRDLLDHPVGTEARRETLHVISLDLSVDTP